jgi:hypothetical protein
MNVKGRPDWQSERETIRSHNGRAAGRLAKPLTFIRRSVGSSQKVNAGTQSSRKAGSPVRSLGNTVLCSIETLV